MYTRIVYIYVHKLRAGQAFSRGHKAKRANIAANISPLKSKQ